MTAAVGFAGSPTLVSTDDEEAELHEEDDEEGGSGGVAGVDTGVVGIDAPSDSRGRRDDASMFVRGVTRALTLAAAAAAPSWLLVCLSDSLWCGRRRGGPDGDRPWGWWTGSILVVCVWCGCVCLRVWPLGDGLPLRV
jgi:hypothetical protein